MVAYARDSRTLLFLLAIIALNAITGSNGSRRNGDDFFSKIRFVGMVAITAASLSPAGCLLTGLPENVKVLSLQQR